MILDLYTDVIQILLLFYRLKKRAKNCSLDLESRERLILKSYFF